MNIAELLLIFLLYFNYLSHYIFFIHLLSLLAPWLSMRIEYYDPPLQYAVYIF